MDLKEKLKAAMKEEARKKREYEKASEISHELAQEYFSLKLGVSPGDEVYPLEDDPKTGKRYKLQLVRFVFWTSNLDATPDIMAKTIYPYGKGKERRVLGRNWSVDPPEDWGNI